MIALACFLSSIQFLISSLIQILSLAWKAAIVILASLITIVKKRKNPAKFSLHRCGPKCFFKSTKHTLFQGRTGPQEGKIKLPKAIHCAGIGGGEHWRVGLWSGDALPWVTWPLLGQLLGFCCSWTSCIWTFSFMLHPFSWKQVLQ